MKKRTYYNKDYYKGHYFLPMYFAQTLTLLCKTLAINKILDVGCGIGLLVKYLNSQGLQTIGCDISDVAVRISGQVKGSATKLPFRSANFDLVTSISMIEHLTLPEMNIFLEEARRVLKTHGFLFLLTPNLWGIDKLLHGKNWFGYSDSTHVQFYSPLSLKKLLLKHAFYKQKFRFRVDPHTPADWFFVSPHLSQFCQFLANFMSLSTPLSYFISSFWVLAQKED